MKPKVLHLIDSFESGGTERQAIQLVRVLHESGQCDVRLACLQNKGLLRAPADQLDIGEIVEYPLTSFYDLNFLNQLHRLRQYLTSNRIDVVHTHCFYTNVFGMAAATLARVPGRVTFKGETDFRTPMQQRVESVAFRLAHRTVANSDAVRARLVTKGVPPDKIVRHYNGMEMGRVAVAADARRDDILRSLDLPVTPHRKFITIVANLRHPVKDIPMFLRAAARVRRNIADAAFIVAGEGQLMAEMRAEAAQLGIADAVFFIGRCDRIADLLFISDVCALSSTAEGFSNSILEYMAAGRPVVATDVGGAREAIIEGETGYIVPSGDDERMAARIIDLLADPPHAIAMGNKGKQRVAEEFSITRHLANTLNLYSELLGGKPSARFLESHAREPENAASPLQNSSASSIS